MPRIMLWIPVNSLTAAHSMHVTLVRGPGHCSNVILQSTELTLNDLGFRQPEVFAWETGAVQGTETTE